MTRSVVPVVVVGAGPAGALTAFLLARAGVEVVLVDRGRPRLFTQGEVLAPECRGVLEQVGLWARCPPEALTPCEAVRVAWRSSRATERLRILHPEGFGWLLDRARFDDWLIAEAADAGAEVLRGASVRSVQREHRGWRLSLQGEINRELSAGVWVDATGRRAGSRLRTGTAYRRYDTLCAAMALATCDRHAADLLVEAVPDGWCYSTRLASGVAVVAFLTDASRLRTVPARRDALRSVLPRAPHIREQVGELFGDVFATAAYPAALEVSARDEGWIAVGDAAFAQDPLSGQGVLFALCSAVAAARAVQRHLAGEQNSLSTYARHISSQVDGYLAVRRAVYSTQRRWNDQPFWRERIVPSQEIEPTWSARSLANRIHFP